MHCVYMHWVYINTYVGKSTPMSTYCNTIGSLCLCHGNSRNICIYRYLARASLWVQRCCVGWLLNSICCEPPLPCQPFGLPAWMAAHSSLHRFCWSVVMLLVWFPCLIVRFRSSGLSATRMHVHQLPLKLRRQ